MKLYDDPVPHAPRLTPDQIAEVRRLLGLDRRRRAVRTTPTRKGRPRKTGPNASTPPGAHASEEHDEPIAGR